jgi:hypothetical protein
VNRARGYFLGICALFAGAILSGYLAGCAWHGKSPIANGTGPDGEIPNLRLVSEPAIYRSGQPTTMAQWLYLRDTCGVSNVIKLNERTEAEDRLPAGMTLYYFPISNEEQLDPIFTGRLSAQLLAAVARIGPGCIVHCQHGQDRTGAAIYAYRRQQGWTEAQAGAELLADGFHPELLGLEAFTRHFENP